MILSPDQPCYSNAFAAVPRTVEAIENLSVEERLRLLWAVYKSIEGLVVPLFPSSAKRNGLVGSLSHQVANLPYQEQVQFLHDLLKQVRTPLTRDYGILSSNAKLAFWYELAEQMSSREANRDPESYQLSAPAHAVFEQVMTLQLSQQIAVLRLITGKMGINPLKV